MFHAGHQNKEKPGTGISPGHHAHRTGQANIQDSYGTPTSTSALLPEISISTSSPGPNSALITRA